MGCFERTKPFKFSREDIDRTISENGLLTMEIEFNSDCNFNCIYCYTEHIGSKGEMSRDEFKDVIVQARDLGAKTIIILGGEPTLYPHLMEMIHFIRSHSISVDLFTNGAGVTEELARELYKAEVFVFLKMNTFKRDIQNLMSGNKGAYDQIRSAMDHLRAAGYPGPEKLLAVSTVICKYNYDELTDLWKWLRDIDIAPYFEMITPQGRAKERKDLSMDTGKVLELFYKLSEIDRKYGHYWEPRPPLVGGTCQRHQYSLVVTPNGNVYPCVGVNIPVGNVRDSSLSDIISNSEVLHKLRNYRDHIRGHCRECEDLQDCYGCRGAAYHLTGDYLGADPLCWKSNPVGSGDNGFPVEAESYLPHGGRMLLVDRLIRVGDVSEVELEVTEEMIFVDEDGYVDNVALIEIVAQSAALREGYVRAQKGQKVEGFLVGIKDFVIFGKASLGDVLKVEVKKEMVFGGEISIVKGVVLCGDRKLAEGEMRIWEKPQKHDGQQE